MLGSKKSKKISVELDSLVGGSTKIKGDVYFTNRLHVDGVVEGNVIAESEPSLLTTSERAKIVGNVKVHSIMLNGEVIGDVYAYKHIELAQNAKVKGNVFYQVIEMAMGAAVNGNLIHMSQEEIDAHIKSQVPSPEPDPQEEPSEQAQQFSATESTDTETSVEASVETSEHVSEAHDSKENSEEDGDFNSTGNTYQYGIK